MDEVLVTPLNPTLKDLAVAAAARNTCPQDPRLAPDQLAQQLGNEIEEYRTEIGGKYLCSPEERCSKCLPEDSDDVYEEPDEVEPPTKRARTL